MSTMSSNIEINGTMYTFAYAPVTDTGVTYTPDVNPDKVSKILQQAGKITNSHWRKGWKPTDSNPPKEPCLYHGDAIPKGSGPVAELKRTWGEVPREWAYLEIAHAVSIGGDSPWRETGGGWGERAPYARTGRALEWACGCITTYTGSKHCRSGHLAGGDYHGREWVFACSELHLEIYAGYALRQHLEPLKLEPVPQAPGEGCRTK